MKNNITLCTDILECAVMNYCDANTFYMTFCKEYKEAKATGEYWNNPAEYDRKYDRYYNEYWTAYDKLFDMCKFAGLDFKSVLAFFKSRRRNCQYHHNWGYEARFSNDRFFPWEEKRAGSVESFLDLCKE